MVGRHRQLPRDLTRSDRSAFARDIDRTLARFHSWHGDGLVWILGTYYVHCLMFGGAVHLFLWLALIAVWSPFIPNLGLFWRRAWPFGLALFQFWGDLVNLIGRSRVSLGAGPK